ncbi:hypothetical protein [Clostridium perfringens]|uniref:hypothetical protein n=1 Tax=Clostridium perfringens TaxID=1502 RepID=UPI0013E3CBFB|nr:hypothetical protein [Clostridium perfringens]ELC8330627.1 hypothetical protein [Clostridium perfringens]NGT02816.1 hypothetical protein [Clostridium perfringens]
MKLRELKIKKNPKTIIWFNLYFTCVFGFLRDILKFPGFIVYFIDLISFGTFLWVIMIHPKKIANKKFHIIIFWFLLFLVITFTSSLVNDKFSILQFLWGFRNTFRFYIFFITCYWIMDKNDVNSVSIFFKRLFYINVLLVILEFAIGYRGDNIGGSFGVSSGCNAYLNLFMVICASIFICDYLDKKISTKKLVIVILGLLICSATSELKIFVIELPCIVLLAMWNSNYSIRKIGLFLLGFFSIFLGITLMGYIFEGSDLNFYLSGKVFEYMGDGGYTGVGDLSRFNAIFKINDLFFFNTDKFLFGFGLGNCSYSSFAFLTSSFFNNYSWMHYHWFADSMIFLETGAIGLFLFETFFILIFLSCRKYIKITRKDKQETIFKYGAIISILSIVISIYDMSLLMESAYMIYFIFALIYVNIDRLLKQNSK